MAKRLTSHQQYVLDALKRRSGEGKRWISASDFGSPAGLEHLHRKGYADKRVMLGPRGGEQAQYRPGVGLFARQTSGPGGMHANEIDRLLIEARERQEIVLVHVRGGVYYRGVPGEVHRAKDDTTVLLPIGAREVPLTDITHVQKVAA